MMRGLVVVTMILGLVASAAMAAPTIKITGPGGVSTYQPAPGATFQVDITIESDIGPMGAWGMDMTRPAGYGNVASLSAGRSYSDGSYLTDPEDPASIVYTNAAGWSPGDSVGWAANVSPIRMGTIYGTQGAVSGWAAKVRLVAPADPAKLAGLVSAMDDVTLYVGNMAGASFRPQVVPLTLTPEPVSALLLLAGLPMLRRRR